MKIALTGGHGFVGSSLKKTLLNLGHEVVLLKRNQEGDYSFTPSDFEGVDVVVNLAGESVSRRWTENVKKKIRDSRVNTTRHLADTISQLNHPPAVVINASAIGYYGNRGDQLLDETAVPGEQFLSQVVVHWENALQLKNTRTVFARFGIILDAHQGALKKMLLPFKMCLGGKIGSGQQYMSWIDIDDVIGALYHIILTPSLQGPVNVVAPNPVTNEEFTKTLGKALHRPTPLPLPASLVKLIFGEMGEDLLLASTRVIPQALKNSGYLFRYPILETALQKELQ